MSGQCSECGQMWSFCRCRQRVWKPKIVQGIDLQTVVYPKGLGEKHRRSIMENGVKVNSKPAVLVEDLPKLLAYYEAFLFDDDTSVKTLNSALEFLRLRGLLEKEKVKK